MNGNTLGSTHGPSGQARIHARSGTGRHRRAWRLRRQQPLCRSAAGQGDGGAARAAADHALFGNHRIDCRRQPDQSGGARCRLCRGHQVQGRFAGQEGHDAVRDRARALQGEARAGQGGKGGRGGIAQAARSRLSAPVRPGEATGRVAPTLESSLAARDSAQSKLDQAELDTGRPRSITAIPRSRRRSTASSPRVWSRSANSSARRADAARHHRADSIRSG